MADKWTPRGVDVRQLREEETILTERLRIVRGCLDALADSGGTSGVRKRRRRSNTRLSQIVGVLKEEGRPLPIQAIHRQLQALNPTLEWKDPGNAFRSCLRDQPEGPDKVVRMAKNTYGLKVWADAEESANEAVQPTGTIQAVSPTQHPEISRK